MIFLKLVVGKVQAPGPETFLDAQLACFGLSMTMTCLVIKLYQRTVFHEMAEKRGSVKLAVRFEVHGYLTTSLCAGPVAQLSGQPNCQASPVSLPREKGGGICFQSLKLSEKSNFEESQLSSAGFPSISPETLCDANLEILQKNRLARSGNPSRLTCFVTFILSGVQTRRRCPVSVHWQLYKFKCR